MDIPRFSFDNLNPRLRRDDLGDTFQVFVYELLLPDYPELHPFNARGKDGGIDLSETRVASRTVVECKYIGQDGLEDARKRWGAVANNLSKHLASASGPTRGQAQYAPWYKTDPGIREYVLVTSSEFGNQSQVDGLQEEVSRFFHGLARERAHLKHLEGLAVRVLDWNDLDRLLRERPHTTLRWFPITRPRGLVPLDDAPERGSLRAYLSSEKLPYYSRSQHLETAPAAAGVDIPNEEALLGALEDGTVTGLILTGGGGVGKTRLALEVGRVALRDGWLVLRGQGALREEALQRLAERVTPETRVLLVVDYVETQRDFSELVDTVNDLNDTYHLGLRYIANCRTSYYKMVAATSQHKRIDLSPALHDAERGWAERYAQQTVRHILEHSGLEVTEEHLRVCRGTPVLAVFLAYLRSMGREPELEELLHEEDFGRWVARRVGLSFGQDVEHGDLALLTALFPMDDPIPSRIAEGDYRRLFDTLATDGWIERLPPGDTRLAAGWLTANDVLADQILLSHCRGIPNTVRNFVEELLLEACRADCLRSALLTLQRVMDEPELRSLDWRDILARQMSEAPSEWRDVRDMVVRTPLLTTRDLVILLGDHDEVWTGAEEETGFQNALGWHARRAVSEDGVGLMEDERSVLESWLARAGERVGPSNYVLTWGLRFSPETMRKAAREWILTRPRLFQTHYLMVAWLECGLPSAEIASAVAQWAERFCGSVNLSFVVRAWLDAEGDKELVRHHIEAWLREHKIAPDARFVYKSWLDAEGKKELVQDHIEAWLGEHGTAPDSDFLYKSWLDAEGKKELVQDHIEAWLREHKIAPEAGFVYQSWLDAEGDKELVRHHIEAWLREHGMIADAQFVYKSWLDAQGEKELVQKHIEAWLREHETAPEAGFVYKAWLDAEGDKELVRDHIEAWLREHETVPDAEFVYSGWLDANGDKEVVRRHIEAWLGQHETAAEAGFVYRAWLDAKGDKELVQDHMESWLREQGTAPDSDFLYRAWLEAGGQFSLVRTAAIGWMRENRDKKEAVYLSKILAKQRDLPAETVRDILAWCRRFPRNEDALWRLTQLTSHLLREELAEDVCDACEELLRPLVLEDSAIAKVTCGQINALFSFLIEAEGLRWRELRRRVDTLLLTWLRHPCSYGGHAKPHPGAERASYVQRIADLIHAGDLDVVGDRELIGRFLEWVDSWEANRKSWLIRLFDFLKHRYPGTDLWQIVKFSRD